MNRSFLILLVLVIFLGAGFGGSFVGGVIYGQSLGNETEGELSPRLGAPGQFRGGAGEVAGGGQRGQGRRGQAGGVDGAQGSGSGPAQDAGNQLQAREAQPQATLEVPAEVSQETNLPTGATDATPAASAARTAGGRGGTVGAVQALDGDLLTVTSARGEVTATLSDATAIYQVSEAGREALAEGATVRVSGSRDPEGSVSAQAVVVLPDGAESLFGGGPGGRQRGQ